jgi:hypothetical protein
VSSNAIYGGRIGNDQLIRFLDIRVMSTGMGVVHPEDLVKALRFAIRNGAKVVTSSVLVPWGHSSVQEVLNANREVMFLASGGNSAATFANRNGPHGLDGETSSSSTTLKRKVSILVFSF